MSAWVVHRLQASQLAVDGRRFDAAFGFLATLSGTAGFVGFDIVSRNLIDLPSSELGK
ncbi:MAG TPA: hypothetical protein VKK06_14050 [Terriglobia bacterium]|nr:hypothetical protein [Terriglobia bacterium]